MPVVYSFPGAKLVTLTPPKRLAVGFGAAPAPGTSLSEYAVGTSAAIASITDDVKSQMAATNPEVAFAIDALSAVVGSITGADPGAPLGVQVAEALGSALIAVVSGSTPISSVVTEALSSFAGFSEVVPFIGQIAGFVVNIVMDAVNRPAVTPAERDALNAQYKQYCAGSRAAAQYPTGPSGFDPSDLVSQGDARMKLVHALALGASRDHDVSYVLPYESFWARKADYDKWLGKAKSKYGITGIPLHVQRQIILLLEGIYAARRDPHPDVIEESLIGDNGRSLMPILLQILLDQHRNNAFNERSLESLANWFIAPGQQFCTQASGSKAGVTCDDYPPCGESVGRALFSMLVQWNASVLEDPSMRAAAKAYVDGTPKTGVLELNAQATNSFLGSLSRTQQDGERFFRAEGFGFGQKLLSVLGATGFGYGVFTALRAVGPRR